MPNQPVPVFLLKLDIVLHELPGIVVVFRRYLASNLADLVNDRIRSHLAHLRAGAVLA